MSKLPFFNVELAYRERPPELESMSLEQFSDLGNKMTNSDSFDAGKTNMFGRGVKIASAGHNFLLEASGANEVGRDIGGFAGSLMGKEELGRQVGEALPRGAVDLLPAMLGPLGIGVSAYMAGSNQFEQTGSKARAALGAGAAIAAPLAIGKISSGLATKALGTSAGTKLFGADAAAKIGTKLTSNAVGGTAARLGGNLLDSFIYDTGVDMADIGLAEERSYSEMGTSDYWAAQAIGNLAFAPLDVKQAITAQVRGTKNIADGKKTAALDEAQAAADALANAAPVEGPSPAPYNVRIGAVEGPQLVRIGPQEGPQLVRSGPVEGPLKSTYTPNEKSGTSIFGNSVATAFDVGMPTPLRVQTEAMYSKTILDHAAKRPVDMAEAQAQIADVNSLRAVQGKVPHNDMTLAKQVEAVAKQGKSEEPIETVIQKVKNEEVIEIDKINTMSDVMKVLSYGKGADPVVTRLVERRLNRNKDNLELFNDIANIVSNWKASGKDLKDLVKRLDNAKTNDTRRKATGAKGKNKTGRKETVPNEDFNTVFDRLESLPDKGLVTNANKAYQEFLDRTGNTLHISNQTNRGARVLSTWLAKKNKDINALKGMFDKESLNIQADDSIAAAKHVTLESVVPSSDPDNRTVTDTFRDDYNGRPELDGPLDANSGDTVRAATLVMMRDGVDPGKARALAPEVAKIADMFQRLTGEDVSVGSILDPSGSVAGLSSRSSVQNAVFLNKLNKGDMATFVASHEILGHQFKKLFELGKLDSRSMKSYGRLVDDITTMTPAQRTKMLRELSELNLPKELRDQLDPVFEKTSNSVDEVMSNVAGILAHTSAKGGDVHKSFMYSSQRLYDFAVAAMQFLRDSLAGVKGLMGLNTLRGQKLSSLKSVRKFKSQIDKAGRKLDMDNIKSQAEFAALDRSTVGGLGRVWADMEIDGSKLDFGDGNKSTDLMLDAMFLGRDSKLRRVLSGMGEGEMHKIERNAHFRDIGQAFRGEKGMRNELQRSLVVFMFSKEVLPNGKVIVPKDKGPVGRVYNDQKAFEAVNMAHLYQRENNISIFDLKLQDPKAYNDLLKDLTPNQKGDVLETMARITQSNKRMQSEILSTDKKNEQYNLATLLRDQMSGSNAQVLKASKEMFAAYERNDGSFQQLAAHHKINPKVPEIFLKSSTQLLAKKGAMFENSNFLVTERRMKQYHVSFTKKGDPSPGRLSFDRPEQAALRVKELRAEGTKVHYPGKGFLDTHTKFGNANKQSKNLDDLLTAADDRTTLATLEQLVQTGEVTQAGYDAIKASRESFRSAFSSENTSKELGSVDVKNNLRAGREELDFIEQHLRYMQKMTSLVPKSQTDAIMRFEAKNPEIVNNDANVVAFADAQRALANFRQPDTATGKAITKGNFLHFLGFNISSGLLEATQAPLNVSPKLVEEGAGIIQSYQLPLAAAAKLTEHGSTGKWNSGTRVNVNGKHRDMYDMLIRKADEQGLIGLGQRQEAMDAQAGMLEQINLGRMSQGKSALSPGKLAGTAYGSAVDASSKLYGLFTGFNERVSIISAMELQMSKRQGKATIKGKDKVITKNEFDAMYNEAVRISGIANNSIGRLDRATHLFDNSGPWRTVAQSVHSLAGFASGQLSNVYRYAQKGYGREDRGFTPAERRQAKKAFIQSTVSLMSMAGVIGGIPGAGIAMALAEEHTQLKPEETKRMWLQEIDKAFGGDEPGTFITDMGTHGISYAMGAPMDFSSRISMGGLLGFNSFEGWSPKALMGPTLSRGEDYMGGIKSVFQGDVTKGVAEALPIGLGRLMKLWTDNGNITDKRGNVLLVPTQSERMAATLGFPPSRTIAQRDAANITYTQDRIRGEKNDRFKQDYIKTYEEKGIGAARNMLNQQESSVLGYDAASALNALERHITTNANGFDPRLQGGLQGSVERSNLLDTFNPSLFPRTSVVDQARTKIRIGNEMGRPRANPGNDMLKAMLTENLRGQSNLPVPVLGQYANQLLRPTMSNQSSGLLDAFASTSRGR